jgi:hypothetical protein
MRKIIALLCVVLLVGCGGNDVNDQINDVKADGNSLEVTTEDGTEVEISTDMDKAVDLPENYPKDIVPIFKDSKVMAAAENADGSFLIMAVTNADLDELKEFYMEILEDSEMIMEQSDDEMYLKMGNMQGFVYTVTIAESFDELDYKHSFTIVMQPELEGFGDMDDSDEMDESEEEDDSEDMDKEEESQSESSDMSSSVTIPESVEWPSDYPEDILPVYDKEYLEVKMAMKNGGQTMVGLMSEEEMDILVEYYTELLKDSVEFTSTAMGGTHMVQGIVDGVMYMVIIGPNDETTGEDERFKSLIQVIY